MSESLPPGADMCRGLSEDEAVLSRSLLTNPHFGNQACDHRVNSLKKSLGKPSLGCF